MAKDITSEWFTLISVFLSGIFGLLTALITWSLANRREKRRLSQEYRRKEWQDLELLYANSIAVIDKIAQVTKAGNDYSGIIDQMTLVSAQISIRGSEAVNKQYHIVADSLAIWTGAYQISKPKKVGESNLSMVTTENLKAKDAADEIFKELLKNMSVYIEIVKTELKNTKPLVN